MEETWDIDRLRGTEKVQKEEGSDMLFILPILSAVATSAATVSGAVIASAGPVGAAIATGTTAATLNIGAIESIGVTGEIIREEVKA